MIALLLQGCGEVPPEPASAPDPAPEADSIYTPLEAPRLLRRISLDLRGVLPSVDALDSVEADPLLIDTYIDAYLDDPLHEERLVHLFSEQWHTRINMFEAEHKDFHLDDSLEFPFVRSVGQEPLRLLARIAVSDVPWSEIVMADYTMADTLLADIWPLDYPAGAQGWQAATYTDGRPPAGVLATNGLWWRYVTSNSNKNRSRVAAISRLLLCEDYLERPVSFSETTGLSDAEIDAAISTDPGCVGCHVTIEPIAATLFGFWPAIGYSAYEMSTYHPERELLGSLLLGVEPAWFGTPIEGLSDLGVHIAGDARFYRCTAQRAAEGLWRRDSTLADFAVIEDLRGALIAGELRYRALLEAVLETEAYRVGAVDPEADAELRYATMTRRMMSPSQYAATLTSLTGFSWYDDGHDLMDGDVYGFRVMAGGVDGDLVTSPQQTPGLTWALVQKRLAEGSAVEAASAGQFGELVLAGPPTRDELAALWWQLYAERPSDAEIDDLAALWAAGEAIGSEEQAWQVLIAAMLREPGFVVY